MLSGVATHMQTYETEVSYTASSCFMDGDATVTVDDSSYTHYSATAVHVDPTAVHVDPTAVHVDPMAEISESRESASSILQAVKEEEAKFERLTLALEAERRSVADQLEQVSLLYFTHYSYVVCIAF